MAQADNSYNRNRRRKKRRKKKSRVILARLVFALAVLLIITLILVGGYKLYGFVSDKISSDVKVTTVTVGRSDTIKETIIEEFNPGFYDEESLENDVDSKIKASGGKVRSEGLTFSNGTVALKLEYDSDDDMAEFNDVIFYSDTIDNLVSQGVSFDSEAIKSGGTHAVIVSESMDIKVPKKILYTGGAVVIDDEDQKLAHCTTDEGEIAFIIY
ncbi:MAG: hypothetical protein IJ641_04810 [Lachnospiraceae bacterium]|nr:hypothetical protein [Lachnospiraceae bacterium]